VSLSEEEEEEETRDAKSQILAVRSWEAVMRKVLSFFDTATAPID
jgi:hypothetical protein